MFQSDKNNVVSQQMEQRYKENYIADMLMSTLFSNNVNVSECYRIIELLKEKIHYTEDFGN